MSEENQRENKARARMLGRRYALDEGVIAAIQIAMNIVERRAEARGRAAERAEVARELYKDAHQRSVDGFDSLAHELLWQACKLERAHREGGERD